MQNLLLFLSRSIDIEELVVLICHIVNMNMCHLQKYMVILGDFDNLLRVCKRVVRVES